METDTRSEQLVRDALRESMLLNGDPFKQPEPKFKFDPSINLGHVLSAVAILSGVVIGWNVMDKRVLVLEEFRQAQKERTDSQRERDSAQDQASKDKFQEVRDALNQLRNSVEKVADRVGVK